MTEISAVSQFTGNNSSSVIADNIKKDLSVEKIDIWNTSGSTNKSDISSVELFKFNPPKLYTKPTDVTMPYTMTPGPLPSEHTDAPKVISLPKNNPLIDI